MRKRWGKIEQLWSSAEIKNNRDGSFEKMAITLEAAKPSTDLKTEKLGRYFDAAMAQGEQ